jgi:RNA polymerase sigma factor (sigma-70 family)
MYENESLEFEDTPNISESEYPKALRMIRSIGKQYTGYGISADDLFQAGWVGYLQGKKKFDINNGCPFYIWQIQNICWEMWNVLTVEFKNRKQFKSVENLEKKSEKQQEDEKVFNEMLIREAVLKLTDQQKLFLKFRFENGLTLTQIASKMNVSQGLLSSLEKQILMIMRADLSEPGEKRLDLIPTLKGGKRKHDD